MIIDQTYKDGKLTISYTAPQIIKDVDGNIRKQTIRKFFETNIARFKSWVYDENGKYNTWDGKKCSPTYHDKPNKLDLMQFIHELPKQIYDAINSHDLPKVYSCDIETDIGDSFPEPDKAEMPITTISLCSPDLSVMVLGTKVMSNDEIKWCNEEYIKYLSTVEFYKNLTNVNPVFIYKYFESEHDMLEFFLKNVVRKCSVITGWNFLPFDWQYITNRVKRYNDLGIWQASPRNQVMYQKIMYKDELIKIPVPRHVTILDYLEICNKYDRTIEIKESMSLDWIANKSLGVKKIKYDGSLKELYNNEFPTYAFYNGIDSVLVQLIDQYMKCLNVLYAYSWMCSVPLNRCLSPVELGTALVFKDFYQHQLYIVYENGNFSSTDFGGGYVKEPIVGKHEWVACNDFASLYPSAITSTNISFENIIGDSSNLSYEQIEAYKKDPNYFVALNNVVYKNDKDYAFRRIQIDLKKERDEHKYFAQNIDRELITYIDECIKEKKQLNN